MSTDFTYKIIKTSPELIPTLNNIGEDDANLLQRNSLDASFNDSKNRIDAFIYSLDGRLLAVKEDVRNYKVIGGVQAEKLDDIELDPKKDILDLGFNYGDVNILYNFVNNLYTSENRKPLFFVESISSDRREIRALSNEISDQNISRFTAEVLSKLDNSNYFEDFRLNFGNNILPIGINIRNDEYRNSQSVVIRLYEPLPRNISIKDTFALEELISDSVLYQVITTVTEAIVDNTVKLRGPNFNIQVSNHNEDSTEYLSLNDLFGYPIENNYYELYTEKNNEVSKISIDHTNFTDFILFSSAEERLRNFYYKASLLEDYRNQVTNKSPYTSSLDTKIESIVDNFDHYDRYLYYETGSWAWPKSSSTRPYTLFSTGSSEVQTWYTNILLSASLYDDQNLDRLISTIPSFIREDSSNEPYIAFVDMIGQYFDNIWIYSKAFSDRYDADNRMNFGISKDIVKDAVQGMGITIHNNNESLENLFSAFIGETYNTGSETSIESVIVAVEGSGSLTGSVGNEHLQPIPIVDYQKEIYKRIYHNLPLLLKGKGTERAVRALINIFGVPSETLSIRTFGGGATNESSFYGLDTEFTSSLGKIRIDSSAYVVSGSTLSNDISTVVQGENYSKDVNVIEIGFSPTYDFNEYIKNHPSMSNFDIDDYIGDPRTRYSDRYDDLIDLENTVLTSGSSYLPPYDIREFLSIMKYFNNSLFRSFEDFLPARSSISSGIIIKPSILNRSKAKQPEPKWSSQSGGIFKNSNTELDFTGSYYTTNFSFEGELSIGEVSGTPGLEENYSSSYVKVIELPEGGYGNLDYFNHNTPNFTGEYSGSEIQITDGELNIDNTFKKFTSGSLQRNVLTSQKLFNLDIDNFKDSNFAVLSSTIENIRKSSNIKLITGVKSGSNYPVEPPGLKLYGGRDNLILTTASHFLTVDAPVNESNYSSIGWSNGRYEGSTQDNRGIVSREPALVYDNFEGSLFDRTGSTADIKSIFQTSDAKVGDVIVFYNTYLALPVESLHFEEGYINQSVSNPVTQTLTPYSESLQGTQLITVYTSSNAHDSFFATGSTDSEYITFYSSSLNPLTKNTQLTISYDGQIRQGDGAITVTVDGININNFTPLSLAASTSNPVTSSRHLTLNIQDNISEPKIRFTVLYGSNASDEPDQEEFVRVQNINVGYSSVQNLLPYAEREGTIESKSQDRVTFFNKKVELSPKNRSGFEKLVNSKIYRFDTKEVYTTNEKGEVINIE